MKTVILLVTWFYGGQSPTNSQTEFTSMEACQVAREAILRDAARLQADADERKRTQGMIIGPAVPRVSVVCVVQ